MKRIILDTNFLMLFGKFRIDLEKELERISFGPYRIFTLSSVVQELNKIASSKGEAGKNAKVALKLIESKKIKIIESSGKVDDALLKMADENTIIATNDIELRKKLKTKTIYLRAKKHLAVG